MDVDILVPLFPPAHWNFAFAMELEGSRYSHPPLGAATLAAYTPEGVNVRILDENVETVDLTKTAPVVAISGMYIQRHRAFELAQQLRKLGRTVVGGGSLVNSLLEESARQFDVCLKGEAEETWPQFLAEFSEGKHKPFYEPTKRFDLSQSRMPRYDLLKVGLYSTGSVQTSRGCPYTCEFCDVPQLDGTRPRTKPVELVIREVEVLYSLGQRSTFFVDDHFLGNRKYALELLKALTKFVRGVNYKMIFYCQATLNVAKDEEVLEALYQANFRRLFIGIESDDPAALQKANKPQNTTIGIREAVQRIQRHNITVWAALLAGFDEDSPEIFTRYVRFAREANIGMVIPGLLQAVPGTDLFDRIKGEGRLIPLRNGSVGGQSGSLDSLLVTNIEPKKMSYDQLLTGYRKLVKDLYEYDEYADRVIGFLKAGERDEHSKLSAKELWKLHPVLLRTLRHYLWDGDNERRGFFLKVMRHVVKTRLRRGDEAVFHLVLYKHLREFYFSASEARVPLAEDVQRLQ